MIDEIPPKECTERVVYCDGGNGPLGHPKVYINLVRILILFLPFFVNVQFKINGDNNNVFSKFTFTFQYSKNSLVHIYLTLQIRVFGRVIQENLFVCAKTKR